MWLDGGPPSSSSPTPAALADPLTGRLSPPLDADGGRGLYLVNQLCDLVQVRSSDRGTTVRVTTWL